jgi:CRISPR-associated protein Cas1
VRRILDLSGATSSEIFRLRIGDGCLLIAHGTADDQNEVRVPCHEVGTLVLGERLALTGAVLGHVTASGGCILSLNDRYEPSGLMLPLAASSAHVERLRLQIEVLPKLSPKLWEQVIVAKILAQAKLVPEVASYAEKVEPGDPANIEAQAARVYFKGLFGQDFKRNDPTDTNIHLNYGYAVLRSVVARALCGAGLHPALGIHHHSYKDPFALASDLMEPARPIVDEVVKGLRGPINRQNKQKIVSSMLTTVSTSRGSTRLTQAYEGVCQSLVDVLKGEADGLDLWGTDYESD